MQTIEPIKTHTKRRVLLWLLAGVVQLAAVFVATAQADLSHAQQSLSSAADYVWSQCARYDRIELATQTKSLMRVIQSCKQSAYDLGTESDPPSSALQSCVETNYLSGILLLDTSGRVLSQYHESGQMPDGIGEALASPALLDTAVHPEKRYAIRLDCADGGKLDLAATARPEGAGIVVVYYQTPAEHINSFNLSIASLLSGYKTENNSTVVVVYGKTIIASNDESLIGSETDAVPILQQLSQQSGNRSPMGIRQTDTDLQCIKQDGFSRYFALMRPGRNFYIYNFASEHNVFYFTPRAMIFALVLYLIAVGAVNGLRLWAIQRYREKQLASQQEYTRQLQEKNHQLSAAVEQADRANAAKTSFLSRMSHDIRTPLNGIIGLLEINAAHPDDAALVSANRSKMRTAADHLLSLINDVLQMSKLESGQVILSHEPLSLSQLAADVLAIVSQRASDSGITMEYTSSPDSLPADRVYGSPVHLRQIFLNIYSNCIKYNKPGGKICSQVDCLSSDSDTVTYRWTISDTGIGMSPDFLSRIFDPFTQEHSDARSVYQGAGLGMPIVKSLIEKMHGTIEIHSQEGVGTTFLITLPFQPAPDSAPRSPVAPALGIRGYKLLLAEDNELNADIARTLLEDAGASVTVVADGKQALERFRQDPPGTYDALLMDMMMPVMDGLSATRAIRALDRPDAKTIPIIATTANAFTDDAEKCLRAGMNAHLPKPLQMQSVIETLVRCCGS